MARRKTRVTLELIWDDTDSDHPSAWDYKTFLGGDPFTPEGTNDARLVTFEDLNDDDRPVQV